MKKAKWLKNTALAVVITSALVTAVMLATSSRSKSVPEALKGIFAPHIALAAPGDQLPGTFDSQLAGLSAYLNVQGTINLSVVESMGTELYEKRSSYVIVAISGIILYAEQTGWLVAYVARGDTSNVASWFPQSGTSKPILRTRDRLYTTLDAVVDKLGIDWTSLKDTVAYTHFNYPSSTRLVVFSKSTYGRDEQVTFQIPNTYTLYEASWSAFNGCSCNVFKLDDTGGRVPNGITRSNFPDISLGTDHSLSLDVLDTSVWLGVAVFLVLG